MESQRQSYQVHQRRRLLNFGSQKITVRAKFAELQVAAHSQPMVRGLYRKMNVLARF